MSRWIRNWFSNFVPLDEPFRYQGMLFYTVENFFQAMKIPKEQVELRAKVAQMTPSNAKRFCPARSKNFTLRPDWEQIKVDVMRFGLKKKFAKGTSHYIQLLRASGQIIESNNWHDNFWGSCVCKRCNNRGQNVLGELLMKIRREAERNHLK